MPANVGPWPKWRSRSPRAPGPVSSHAIQTDSDWVAMRKGAPERRPRARGKFPSLDSAAEREYALAVVRTGRYTVSSQAGVESHRRFILKALGKWCLSPYPPTVDKVEMIAAALKAGNYRSPANYLGQYSADSERAGYDLSDPIRRAFRDMNRSCARGLGPGVKSKGLPMDAFATCRSRDSLGRLAAPSVLATQSWSAHGSLLGKSNSPLRGLA